MAKKKNGAKWTLITNITSVGLANGISADASALVIQPANKDIPFGHSGTRLRGFGTAGSLPTFTVYLNGDDAGFELRDASDPSKVFLSDDGQIKPLFSGAILKICGQEFGVQISDPDRPMAIDEFDDVTEVWKKLPIRVCEFWMFPAMPSVRFLPVHLAKSIAEAAKFQGGL